MGRFSRSERGADLGSAPGGAVAEHVDTTYALAGGLYVTALVTPAALALAVQSGISGAAALYVAFLVVVTVTTIGTAFAVRRLAGLPERLGRSRRQWAFVVVAGVTAAGYLVAGEVSAFPTEMAVIAVFTVAYIGGLFGVLLAAMSRTRYIDAIVADEPVECEWEAGWPRRWRIGVVGTSLAMIAVGFLTAFLDLVPDGIAVTVFGWIAYVSGFVLLNLGESWTYRARPSGLERTRSVIRRLDRWNRITSVEQTETTLTIRRRGWWRPPIHCAWADLEDSEAIRENLDRYVADVDGARGVDGQ